MEKYDVGLVNFGFANNYGAILTAYALYESLTENGYKTLMIDKPQFWWPGFKDKHNTISREFMDTHVKYLSEHYTRENISELNNLCKSFVVGSDQLWNYALYKSAGEYTLLDFADDKKLKVSYGTSFGHDKIFARDIDRYKFSCYLKRFNSISVREKGGVDLLKNEFGVDSTNVLDAVFLPNKEKYVELAAESKMTLPKKKYLFAYVLDNSDDKMRTIDKLCKKYNLDKIVYGDIGDNWRKGEESESIKSGNQDLKVVDWLYALQNAEMVFTDSFHGTCFSLIFNKPLVCFKNEGRGLSRFESIFSNLGVPDAVGCSMEQLAYNDFQFTPIDYSKVNKKIAELRQEALNWLLNALSKPKPNYVTQSELYGQIAQFSPNVLAHGSHFTNIAVFGLGEKTYIRDIVFAMPTNSTLLQVQGAMNEPLADTPAPYGVLSIAKTTDYFVQITFARMTINGEDPELYQAKWVNGSVRGWTKYVPEARFVALEKKVSDLEALIKANKSK